jgi:hypothetical protein
MEKKSKVTKVTKYDKKDDYGNTSYGIELENGDKGYFKTKNDNQNSFVVGQETAYNIETLPGKEGKPYCKITTPKENKPWNGSGKPQQDPKTQMISFAMAYTKDLVVGGKLNYDDIEKGFENIYRIMTKKLA